MSRAATSDVTCATASLRSGVIGAPSNTCLHCHPPVTPAIMFGRWRYFAGALGLLLLTLAVAAWVDGGRLLLRWDEPVQRMVEN